MRSTMAGCQREYQLHQCCMATYVNITNNIDNERKTNRGEESKQKNKQSMTVSSCTYINKQCE